ncbi:MAG: TolC family protein, partial [Candidatus Binatia bacterium]
PTQSESVAPIVPAPTGGRVLSLEEAFTLALANEEQIKIAGHELAKAQLLPWRALTQLAPRVDINASYTRNKEEIAFSLPESASGGVDLFGGQTSVIRPLDRKQALFTAVQPIFQPAFLPAWRLGQEAVREGQQRYGFTIREVLFGVAQAYYEALQAGWQAAIARETLRLSQDELKQAQARFRVGEVTKTDVLRAEVETARAERALVANRNRVQLGLTVLARTVGLNEQIDLVEPTPPSYTGEGYEELLEKAYARRQDLRAQTAAVAAARQRRNLVRARYFPQVNVQWQFPKLDTETFAERDEFWVMLLTLQVPIFDGGVRELDWQEQNENLAQAELQLDRLRKDIRVEVKRALLLIETLGATLDTLKKEATLAQENYDITSKQYRVGLATSLDVNTALNTLNQVRTQLADQTYQYQLSLLSLDKAVGIFAQNYMPQR